MSDKKILCKKSVFSRLRKHQPLWGGWTITHFIGAGAHGCVFRLERETLGRQYVSALKVIALSRPLGGRGSEPEALANLLDREAQEILLLYRLGRHTNVVAWQDHEVFHETSEGGVFADVCVRMDYLPDSLAKILESDSLSASRILRVLSDVLDGLAHIHDHGIVHRDLKPENIFVDEKGTAKIGDFGVARTVARAGRGSFGGTPLYMAPEVFENPLGAGHDLRADLYSLGLVAYEMFTGTCLLAMRPALTNP